MHIQAAKLKFNDAGTPVSETFDDIYFSCEDGFLESQYVFFEGNGIEQRWLDSQGGCFVIGETGFGSALNFLMSWQHHRQLRQSHPNLPRLHFISFEKYPLSHQDLAMALNRWSELQPLLDLLLLQYPEPLGGCHRMSFDQGRVTLDLWLGDIQDTLPQLYNQQLGLVDAWYLDGFAPTKNTAMWHPDVIKGLARLSKPKATIATFSCARIVKDALLAAGFSLSKRKGFGKKREMLMGKLNDKPAYLPKIPFNFRHPRQGNNSGQSRTAIIGGGIASAAIALALAKRGEHITLYCKDTELAQGASQNRQGALYPLLHASNSPLSEFFAHAYRYALRHYHDLLAQGFEFAHDFCGVIVQSFDEKSRQRHQSLVRHDIWPAHLVKPLDKQQCSQVAGLTLPHDGLYFPSGGWIHPGGLIQAQFKAAAQLSSLEIKLERTITELTQSSQGQWLVDEQQYDNAIICCGHLAKTFAQTSALAMDPIRGQVSHLRAVEHTRQLKTVLCYSGYITPEQNGEHCIGASFIKGDDSTELRQREHDKNLERLRLGIGETSWFDTLETPTQGKAAIRCASVDHLPLIGAVPDNLAYQQSYRDLYKGLKPAKYPLPPDYHNLYIFGALGARGLCSAPLGAEILAAQIYNEPYPAAARVLDALNPGRGYIKQLKRKQPFSS